MTTPYQVPFEALLYSSAETVPVTNAYCIGRNYAAHAKELGNEVPSEPVVFLKTTTALRGLEQHELAFPEESFHHEAELILLIGKPVALGATAGWESVKAVGLGLDLTRRTVQDQLKAKGLPWTAAKSFAGSGLVSPMIPPASLPDLRSITFELSVNGEVRQRGDTALMLYPVEVILTHLAKSHRLVAGDLVFTGTPAGVGPLRRGDRFRLSFTQIHQAFDGRL